MELVGGFAHRLQCGRSDFGFGGLGSEDLEEELFVEPCEFAVGGDGEQLVGEIHEHAVIAGGVIGEGDAQLAGHERWDCPRR